jgi:hypothetical protein
VARFFTEMAETVHDKRGPAPELMEVDPLPFDPNVRFSASPRGPHWPASVGQIDMPLRHHFNQVSITELVSHVPPNTEGDDLVVKVTTLKRLSRTLMG